MSDTVIQVEGLGKQYRINHLRKGDQQFGYVALRDVLAEKVKALFGTRNPELGTPNSAEDFWALKDVSFGVKQGERIGIIGRNGAGKSTLLKILSRITEPTRGRVRIKGRVASLLEVGTGFHPELTGRENIFLNGAVLGMTKVEIKKKFDEIVAFAEVEKFLDTPVKRYSSGMYVRLAFAVAAHLEPEILIVDEVLAVGDAAFQKKCLGKMQEVADKEGRTVLFVSHNMQAVSRLCGRCLLLEAGSILEDGPSDAVVADYLATQVQSSPVRSFEVGQSIEAGDLTVTQVCLMDGSQQKSNTFDARQAFEIHIEYVVRSRLAGVWVGFGIRTSDGVMVFSGVDADDDSIAVAAREPGTYDSVCRIPARLLNAGRYLLTVRAALQQLGQNKYYADFQDTMAFEVINSGGVGNYGPTGRVGIISPKLEWEMKQLRRQ